MGRVQGLLNKSRESTDRKARPDKVFGCGRLSMEWKQINLANMVEITILPKKSPTLSGALHCCENLNKPASCHDILKSVSSPRANILPKVLF